MSTSLDRRAYDMRKTFREKAKADARAAAKRAAQKLRDQAERENGVRKLDIFRKKKEAEAAATKQAEREQSARDADAATVEGEQEPREAGGGRTKVVGFILDLIEEDRAAIQSSLDMDIAAFEAVDDIDVLRNLHQSIVDKTVALLPQTGPFRKGKRDA